MSRCPAIDELEHALSAPQATDDVARHLEACPRCRARARRIRANQSILQITSHGDRRDWSAALQPDSAQSLAPAGGLSGYEILGELHRGGQGVVYRAFQKATKRTVAIKVLLRGAFATTRQRNRFEREIEIAASLRHPNIVSIFESGVDADGSHYLVMNYVDGVALDAWAGTTSGAGTPLHSARERLELFCKICDAVSSAHQRGIIHRDLKPANILIDAAGEPHVLDFGLAKAVGLDMKASEANMTRTGEFMGTFSYAAPEQLRGDPDQIDTRTDVYALGVILFQMLTGRFPYSVDGSLSAILRNITEVEPRLPSEYAPAVDDELNTIVIKALSKPRERRYQSAGALRRDIVSYLAGEPIDAKRDSRWYMLKKTARRYRAALAISVSFFALVAVLGIVTAVGARRTARERDRALVAEHRSAENARELAAALAESRIERARSLESTGDIAMAEQLLWEEFLDPAQGVRDGPASAPSSDPQRRRAYWALWELNSASPCLRTWQTHDAATARSAISGDGRTIIAFGADGIIKVWDTATARLLKTYLTEPRETQSMIASANGDAFASFGADEKVRVWELGSDRAELGAVIDSLNLNLFRMDMCPIGRNIAISDAPGRIAIRDRLTGEERAALHVTDVGSALAYSSDGTKLGCGSHAGRIEVWELDGPGGAPTRQWSVESHKARVRDMCFSPDGTTIAAVGAEGDENVKLLDTQTGRLIRTLVGHTSHINSVSFRGDGLRLATCSFDRSVRMWDPGITTPLATFRGHAANIAQARFVPGADMIASIAVDRTARLWDVRPRGPLHRTKLVDETVSSICISPDGRHLFCGASDGLVHRINPITAGADGAWPGHKGMVSAVAISADGRTLASAGYDGTTRIWDASTGLCRQVCGDGSATVSSVAFHPDGRLVAAGCDDGVVRLWDAASGQLVVSLRGGQEYPRRPMVAFAPDGKSLATVDSRSDIVIWDWASGLPRATMKGHRGQLRCVAFSPDGDLLASAGDDATIRLWGARSGESLGAMEGNRDEIFSLAFSPDGTMLASGGRGRQVTLWDVSTRKCLATLGGHTNMIFATAFSPDGRLLASCAADGTFGLCDLSYYDRHIAGNLEYQLSRLPSDRVVATKGLRDWSNQVLARPATPFQWPVGETP